MFPETKAQPTQVGKLLHNLTIARSIPFDLWAPVSLVRLGLNSVKWAAMPKATVDEHGKSGASKY